MAERVLLFGSTGVDKETVVANMLGCDDIGKLQQPDVLTVDFEKEYVLPSTSHGEFHDYLDALDEKQQDQWNRAWTKFRRRLSSKKYKDQHVILSLHGVLARPIYGIRTPVLITSLVQGFKPTRVVTLIDDVYLMWYRTEKRAKAINGNGNPLDGYDYVGRPSLYELLAARRAELFFGDVVARNCKLKSSAQNIILGVQHPARVLWRLLFAPQDVMPVYLSFPISGPRRRFRKSKGKDVSGFAEVNQFLRHTAAFERSHPQFTFLCPLAIDELPLEGTFKASSKTRKHVKFHLTRRWNVRDFYGHDEKLLCDDSQTPKYINLEREHLEKAIASIRPDVMCRDYRLVLQSRRLVVFNPWFEGEETKGVRNEITCALFHNIPVRIYQDPSHDPSGQAESELRPKPGILGGKPGAQRIRFHKSVEELLDGLTETL